MFEKFARAFKADDGRAAPLETPPDSALVSETRALLETFGGISFEYGLYRIMNRGDVCVWHRRISDAFPDIAPFIQCFAFDWCGSVYAIDQRDHIKSRGILMFEPGTGQALEIPFSLQAFHEVALIEDRDSIVIPQFYQKWRKGGGAVPNFDQCVGYKKPLFLGGSDDVDNLELTDNEVYWSLMGDLIIATRDLAPGTKIGRIDID